MFKKKRALFLFAITIIFCCIFWILKRPSAPQQVNKMGEMPFIRVEYYYEEREGKPLILEKGPLEACVEMVMNYWGTPPTVEEVRSLVLRSIGEGESIYKILRRHKLSFLYVASLDEDTIRNILQLQIPIIASCNMGSFRSAQLSYHNWFVLKEFKEGRFSFNDPLTTASLEMDADLFINAYWLTTNNYALLIFPPPKKKLLMKTIPPSCFKEARELKSLERPVKDNLRERIISQLRNKLKKNPSPSLAYILGWRLSREHDEEGLLWLKKAYVMKPLSFYKAEYAIAHCYLGKNEEALRLLKEFTKENPKYIALPNVFFHLCYLLSKDGKKEEIKRLFQKASAIAPPHLLATLVEIYSQTLSNNAEKIRLLQDFLERYPWAKSLKGTENVLVHLLLWEGRWKEAEKLLLRIKADRIPIQDECLTVPQAIKYISEGKKEEAEEIYNQLSEESLLFKIIIGAKLGKWKDISKELSILIERLTPRGDEYYEKRMVMNVDKLYHLPLYIEACIHLQEQNSIKKAIEDFINIYESVVVIGYESYVCYAYATGGMICYWKREKEKAKEWLSKAYHNPYFKELDPLLVKDVSKALKELEKTNP